MRVQPIFDSTLSRTAPAAGPAIKAPRLRPKSRFPQVVDTTAEVLWTILLFLVIGFLVSKAPTISAVFDETAAAIHRGGQPVDPVHEAQIRDLDLRMAADEHKLSTLEHGYAQLRQRHADLLRAYAALQQSPKPQGGGMAPQAAARLRN